MKNKDCSYYPCHEEMAEDEFDCTFCFCPLYPCKDYKTGGKWIRGKDSKPIWDCSECTIIHRDYFVKDTKDFMRERIHYYLGDDDE